MTAFSWWFDHSDYIGCGNDMPLVYASHVDEDAKYILNLAGIQCSHVDDNILCASQVGKTVLKCGR